MLKCIESRLLLCGCTARRSMHEGEGGVHLRKVAQQMADARRSSATGKQVSRLRSLRLKQVSLQPAVECLVVVVEACSRRRQRPGRQLVQHS